MIDHSSQETDAVADARLREEFADLFKIDFAEIAAATEPDQHGGYIVYDSGNYATDEEADEALEDFFDDIMDGVIDKLIEAAREKP
jgi:hypothetical protein